MSEEPTTRTSEIPGLRGLKIMMTVTAMATTITAVIAMAAAFYAVRAANAIEDAADDFAGGIEEAFEPFASEGAFPSEFDALSGFADLTAVRSVTGIDDRVDDATLQEAADGVCFGTYTTPKAVSDTFGLRTDHSRSLIEGGGIYCARD